MVNELSWCPILSKVGFFFLMAATILNAGCQDDGVPSFDNVEVVEGLRPVYISQEEAEEITTLPARALEQPGKITIYRHYLFINEVGKGVHIFDNAVPENPKPLSFLKIAGNIDIAIKEDILYADNVADLVALDISNLADIKIMKRIKDVFISQMAIPPKTSTYFECPDPSKGVVVGWRQAILKSPQCYR